MAQFNMRQLGPPEAYHLMTRVVAPRPIALVSTLDVQDRANLAPFSFFMIGGANPPSCVFCPVNTREGRAKDTLSNVEQTGEYVINVCTREIAEQVNRCSYPYEHGVSEFEVSGLTPLPSRLVKPPRVEQSPVQLECRLHQLVRHGDGPLASNYVMGEILLVHVQDDLLDAEGRPDDARIRFIGRLGADYYSEVTPGLFQMPRPTEP